MKITSESCQSLLRIAVALTIILGLLILKVVFDTGTWGEVGRYYQNLLSLNSYYPAIQMPAVRQLDGDALSSLPAVH